jgi:hypothetical protein
MNRREFLKRAGVLSAAVILALYSSPSDAADPQSVTVLVNLPLGFRQHGEDGPGSGRGGEGRFRNERRSKAGR